MINAVSMLTLLPVWQLGLLPAAQSETSWGWSRKGVRNMMCIPQMLHVWYTNTYNRTQLCRYHTSSIWVHMYTHGQR